MRWLLYIVSFILFLLSVTANAVDLYSFWKNETIVDSKTPLTIFLSLCLLVSLLLLAATHVYYQRQARYTQVIAGLYRIGACIQKHCNIRQTKAEDIEQVCRQIVTHLAQLLSEITGKKCFACIKTPVIKKRGEEVLLTAVTLCRDADSQEREQLDGGVDHWIYKNTAFQKIHHAKPEQDRIFLSNYLPLRKDYDNTSFGIYGGEPPNNRLIRMLKWPLPYKSTIVISILSDSVSPDNTKMKHVIGMLCVDSASMGIFYEKCDNTILRLIADSLSPLILQYKHLQDNNRSKTQRRN